MSALSPERVEPLLTGRFGRPYVYAESCESTQRELDPSLPEGAVAVAEEQTAGRGRLWRTWEAPSGSSILVSVLLKPPPARRAAELALVAGVAVAQSVESAVGAPALIKWPNDVLLGGRKVAGVLAEARAGAVILGIGVNVRQSGGELPAGTKLPAGSLRGHDGVERDRAPILAELLARLEAAYDGWRDHGLEAVAGELRARDFLSGRGVAVDGVEGVAVGIDADGRLELETVSGRVAVESGEVTLR